MDKLVIIMIRVLYPYLKAMAEKTESPIDDMVIKIIYDMINPKDPL